MLYIEPTVRVNSHLHIAKAASVRKCGTPVLLVSSSPNPDIKSCLMYQWVVFQNRHQPKKEANTWCGCNGSSTSFETRRLGGEITHIYLYIFNIYIYMYIYIWSNCSDHARPHPKRWLRKGNHLISGKSRLVKYYSIWPYIYPGSPTTIFYRLVSEPPLF